MSASPLQRQFMLSKPTTTTTASSSAPTKSSQHISSFQKRNNMSLTQTYQLAHQARGKLSKEASRAEYNLRVLVGHANLLDGLMLELAEAERQQESWFNTSVRAAAASSSPSSSTKPTPKKTTITWAPPVPVTIEEEDSESDSDSEVSDDEDEMSLYQHNAHAAQVEAMEIDEVEDDLAADEELQLVRTVSRSPSSSFISYDHLAASPIAHSPPELLEPDFEDSEGDASEDDDEGMPPSPSNLDVDMDVDVDDAENDGGLDALSKTLEATAKHYQAEHKLGDMKDRSSTVYAHELFASGRRQVDASVY